MKTSTLVLAPLLVAMAVLVLSFALPWATFEGEGSTTSAPGFRLDGGLWIALLIVPLAVATYLVSNSSPRWALLAAPTAILCFAVRWRTLADIADATGYVGVEGSLGGVSNPTLGAANLDGSFVVESIASGLGLTLLFVAMVLIIGAILAAIRA